GKVMRRKLSLVVLAAVGICFAASFLNGPHSLRADSTQTTPSSETKDAVVRPGSPGCCARGVAPRELDFPYYSLKDGYQAILLLVSDSPQPVDLTIAIRNTFGQMLTTTATLQPQAKLPFDLAGTITSLGGDPTGAYAEGSVAVYYMGTIMPVVGQITETNPELGLTHQVDMVENDPGRSDIPAVLNGVWWGIGGGQAATVTVTNSSDTPQFANVYLDFQGSRHAVNPPLSFGPFETKTLDVGQLLASAGASPASAPEGGITIQQIGPNPALMASGKITDPATGFSSTIDFPAPERQLASALHATGLPIGVPTKDSPYAGTGTFIPHVVVRNLSGTLQYVTITVEYSKLTSQGTGSSGQSGSQPASQTAANTHNEKTSARTLLPGGISNHPEWGAGTGLTAGSSTVLASMPVGPYSTEDFSLASVMDKIPLPLPFCSIRIQYSGAPGSVEAQVSSVEENNNLIVDATPQNEGDGWAGSGANPWHIDKNTESVLFLTNMGDKPSRIAFEVTANNVHYYLTQLVLSPHETRAIDLRVLRDAQQADLKGNKIPASATDGSVNWVRADLVPVTGRVVVINRRDGTASGFDCCTGNCPTSDEYMYFNNLPAGIVVGSSNFQAVPVIGDEDCNDTYYYLTGPFDNPYFVCTWSSWDTTVATVDSSGWVTGVAGGATTLEMDATGTQYDCNMNCNTSSTQLTATGGVSAYTSIQHTYSSNPFGSKGCWISQFFDHISPATGRKHQAEDVVYPTGNGGGTTPSVGDPVYAAEGGTVKGSPITGVGPANPPYPNCTSHAANYIKIHGSDGYDTVYIHATSSLHDGDPVQAGQPIGTVDNSGCESAPHVHVQREDASLTHYNFALPCVNSTPTKNLWDGLVDDIDDDY
ncbi:MAG: peptidoglycan DD-metalloendopeptidase family protein, partial [Terriglobia bacterium]